MKKRVVALVDCNNFFVACERLRKPELLNGPVCVLSNNDGCVVSRSNEAKRMGVEMGAPYFICKNTFSALQYMHGKNNLQSPLRSMLYCSINKFAAAGPEAWQGRRSGLCKSG